MAIAYAQYQGNGSNRNFNVTFPYISKDHVQVKVNGVITPFTWLTSSTVQLATAPPTGSVVDVRRVTPRDKVLVDFVDGSTLVESDLDLSALQVFYLAQEAFDLGEASLGVTDDGAFSALNRRISNVLDPTAKQDVATKNYVDSGVTSQVNIATQKAKDAASSASAAKTSETNAKTSETNANTSKNTATTKASEAAASAADALASQKAAATSASAAAGSASDAASSKTAAANSAAAAAQSAEAAALFNPSSYYTRAQIDSFKFNLLDGQNGAYYRDLANSTGKLPNGRFSGNYDGIDYLTVNRIRVLSTNDASETSTAHGFQVGADSGANIIIDTNEIIARNAGVLATLNLVGSAINLSTTSVSAGGKAVFHEGNLLNIGTSASSARSAMGLGELATLNWSSLVYGGTSNSNTNFPVGTYLWVWCGDPGEGGINRNMTKGVYLSSARTWLWCTGEDDSAGEKGTQLAGVWRLRGFYNGNGSDWCLMQRVS